MFFTPFMGAFAFFTLGGIALAFLNVLLLLLLPQKLGWYRFPISCVLAVACGLGGLVFTLKMTIVLIGPFPSSASAAIFGYFLGFGATTLCLRREGGLGGHV